MTGIVEVSSNVTTRVEWPGIVSRFQLVILATHRSKQLLKGAQPRIIADKMKRRNTSIALEELKRGLVPFKPFAVEVAQIPASDIQSLVVQ
ncbi:MAG TPA: DNA-directed RNA polymerase subunit omega [Pyrinomonadaceae bacterium]|nr:DNA-directed RNA polymerase subunit omega [Pyrinomonadaceae bacterium]